MILNRPRLQDFLALSHSALSIRSRSRPATLSCLASLRLIGLADVSDWFWHLRTRGVRLTFPADESGTEERLQSQLIVFMLLRGLVLA